MNLKDPIQIQDASILNNTPSRQTVVATRGSFPYDAAEYSLGLSKTDVKKLKKLIDEKVKVEGLKFIQHEWTKGTPHVKKKFPQMPTESNYDKTEYQIFFAYDCHGCITLSDKKLSNGDIRNPGDETAWVVGPVETAVKGVPKFVYVFYIY